MKATNQSAYLKAGLLGFQGSGKTYTAVEIAIGLYRHTGATKPVYFLDTETGSDWSIPRFEEAGIELLVAKTRAFGDLLTSIKTAEKDGSILIIDSVSHFWTEMIEAYKRKKNIGSRMAFHHWGVLKPEWAKFSTAYVNSKLHIIICGRAGWEWGHEDDGEGHKELRKIGTKMKVEGEFAFEPSLLLEMEKLKGPDIGDRYVHRCYVIKDRNMGAEGMDGMHFDNPRFDDFLPHIRCLNIGGDHLGVDTSRNSDEMFAPEGESFASRRTRTQIKLEEINGELEMRYPGTAKDNKIAKAALKKHLFATYSDTQLEALPLDFLDKGFSNLLDIFAQEDYDSIVKGIIEDMKTIKKEEQ